jgi:hypothetical protein
MPPKIFLIKTSGFEEGNAAYTRMNSIYLPKSEVNRILDSHSIHLLIHELFHIYSKHNPEISQKLYATIGFDKCNEIEIPESYVNIKITNPDAPFNNHYINVNYQNEKLQVIPFIFSSIGQYDPEHGEPFFKHLKFQLMALHKINNVWEAKTNGKQPILINISDITGYFEQIGENTNYIIHPEEILAENFVHLILENEVKTQSILDEMKQLLLY